MKKLRAGGGWQAIWYTLRKGREVGFWNLWRAMRSNNACKTCALGMGGQQGGMVNELGHFPEVCKKSLQAMAADMQGAIKPEFWSTYSIAQLQALSPRELESCGRLAQPVLHQQGTAYYRPIEWSEALDLLVQRLQGVQPNETFWYFSGRSSNEAAFLLQLFARLYGTNNVNNCSYYCHQASGVGLTTALGTGTATITLEDLEHADMIFVIGGNPASNHPRLMSSLMRCRRRGGQVIVVNPVVETGLVNFRVPSDPRSLLLGSEIASMYVQPHIGGDLALLTGMAKRIEELGASDTVFLNQYCEGWPELQEHLRKLTWEEVVAKSGVSKSDIFALVERYVAANNVVFSWTMGITHHAHGVQNVQAIVNVAAMRGMLGRAGAGVLPIRGHSNVQGIGSVGVTPKLRDAVLERLQSHFQVQLPTTPGLDTLACIDGAAEGRLKVGICLGGNLYGSNPDAKYAASALANLDFVCYLNTTLNTGHAHGLARETLILPVAARDEESQTTTQESMFNLVRLSDGGPARHAGCKSEVELVAILGERLLPDSPLDWNSMREHRRIREAMAKVLPGFEQLADIDRTKQEFQIHGRTLHAPQFPREGGRARLFVHALPDLPGTGDELRLMTVRSEGQFNTVVYEDYDLYRGQERRDVILMHPADIARLGFTADTQVEVRSSAGSMRGIWLRSYPEIKAGNALMYYPEANAIVPRVVDPDSRTPAFKSVLITVHRLHKENATDVRPAALVGQGGASSRDSMRAC